MKKILLAVTVLLAVACGNDHAEPSLPAEQERGNALNKNNNGNDDNAMTDTEDLKITVHEEGTGEQLKSGDFVLVHYKGMLEDSTVFDSSFERNEPLALFLGKGMVIKGWEEALTQMKEGEKATVWIPAEKAYGEQERENIPANSNLIFEIEVLKPISTPEGLKVHKIKETEGEAVEQGDKVAVHYRGFLRDGKIFDESYKRGQPIEIDIPGQVIRGWNIGIPLLKEGEKAYLDIPSNLGYGPNGMGQMIPPNADLLFLVELVEIK